MKKKIDRMRASCAHTHVAAGSSKSFAAAQRTTRSWTAAAFPGRTRVAPFVHPTVAEVLVLVPASVDIAFHQVLGWRQAPWMNEPPTFGSASALTDPRSQNGVPERADAFPGRYEQRVPFTVRCVRTGSERTQVPLRVQLRADGADQEAGDDDASAPPWESSERYARGMGVSAASASELSTGRRVAHVGPLALRTLRLRITDPADPIFLYEWRMTEEEYPRFKADQCLFVDFGRFPRTLVDLFEQCRREGSGFHALLRLEDGAARLSVFETTAFRNLPHLALELQAASGERLQRYLVSSLHSAERRATRLEESMEQMRRSLDERTARVQELMGQVAQLQQERSQAAEAARAQHQAELAEVREQALKEALQRQEQWQQERRALEERYREEIATLSERIRQNETDMQRLTDERYAREQQIRQLELRLSAQQSEHETMRSELDRVRQDLRERARAVHELERQLDAVNAQIQGLERALQDKDAWIERMRQMLELANAQKSTLEETILAHREARARLERQLEAAAAEIERGNSLLERLQSALREAKTKARLKAAVAEQQEALLRERQREIDALREQLTALTTHTRPWRAPGAPPEPTSASASSEISAP